MKISKKDLINLIPNASKQLLKTINDADEIYLVKDTTCVPRHHDSEYIEVLGMYNNETDLILTVYKDDVKHEETNEIYISKCKLYNDLNNLYIQAENISIKEQLAYLITHTNEIYYNESNTIVNDTTGDVSFKADFFAVTKHNEVKNINKHITKVLKLKSTNNQIKLYNQDIQVIENNLRKELNKPSLKVFPC